MNVLSVPSIPWGWKTRWSLTQTESKPICSARRVPSMMRPRSVSGPKCGKSKPYSVAMIGFLLFLPLQWTGEPAVARLAYHFSVLKNKLPPHQCVYRQAAHFPPGVWSPATLAENLGIRDRMLLVEIDGDHIGICPHANRALPRIKTKQLRRLCRNDLDSALE